MTAGVMMGAGNDELQCIAGLVIETYKKGKHWFTSLKPDDWRSLRYRTGRPQRLPNGCGGFPQEKLGKPPVPLEDSEHTLRALVIDGHEKRTNILVQPDSRADKEAWIPILSIVVMKNLDGVRHVNFHLWFHGVARANLKDDQILGWRFEGSEGKDTTHDLFHAQPVRSFGQENETPGFVAWMPDTFPTIPVAAKDNLQLGFAALVTLGGKESLRRIILNATDAELRRRAREYWGSIYGEAVPKGKEEGNNKP